MRVFLFIHDAVIIEAHEDHAQEAMSSIRWMLENPPLEDWFDIEAPLPIVADVSVGPNLGEMEEVEVPSVCPAWFDMQQHVEQML